MQSRQSERRRALIVRRKKGSILPMVVFALLFIFAFLSFSVDVMHEILKVQQMRFAARAAASSVLPVASLDADGNGQNVQVVDANGKFTNQALSNMANELNSVSGTNGVEFNSTDLSEGTISSTADNGPYLKVTAKQRDNEAMELFFIPVRYAASLMTGGATASESDLRIKIVQSAEVSCQPAVRIGPGANSSSQSRRGQEVYTARLTSFPVAIDYDDFKRVVSSSSANTTCTLRISTPGAAQYPSANMIRAYFVNLKQGGAVSDYYYDAQNSSRVDDLIGLIEYFNPSATAPQAVQVPAAVERSVQLDRFSKSALQSSDLVSVLGQLPTNKAYIFPVARVQGGTLCDVQGFAFLKLNSVSASNTDCDFSVSSGESVPVVNCSAGPSLKTIPRLDGSKLPAIFDRSNNPFAPRSFDAINNQMSGTTRGVVMAPTYSPRKSAAAG